MSILRNLSPGDLRWTGRAAGLVVLAFIAFATLSPIGLRPQVASQGLEHVLAYGVLAALFGIGFPRHLLAALACVACLAIGMEALQALSPGRHARIDDAAVKVAGACVGAILAFVVNRLADRLTTNAAAERPRGGDRA